MRTLCVRFLSARFTGRGKESKRGIPAGSAAAQMKFVAVTVAGGGGGEGAAGAAAVGVFQLAGGGTQVP